MNIRIPEVLSIDERTTTKHLVRRMVSGRLWLHGNVAAYSKGTLTASVFEDGEAALRILIVPPKSKQIPGTFTHVLQPHLILPKTRMIFPIRFGYAIRCWAERSQRIGNTLSSRYMRHGSARFPITRRTYQEISAVFGHLRLARSMRFTPTGPCRGRLQLSCCRREWGRRKRCCLSCLRLHATAF